MWSNGEEDEDNRQSNASSLTFLPLTFFSCDRSAPTPTNRSPQIELGDLPIVILRVGPYKVKALMDSGAVLTAISSELASLISQRWHAWEGADLKLADGKQARPLGVITVELELSRKVMQMPVAILQKMGIDVILGTNFMGAMDIVLMAGRRRWFFFEDLEVKYNMNLGLEKSVGPYLVERREVANTGVKRPTTNPFKGTDQKIKVVHRRTVVVSSPPPRLCLSCPSQTKFSSRFQHLCRLGRSPHQPMPLLNRLSLEIIGGEMVR